MIFLVKKKKKLLLNSGKNKASKKSVEQSFITWNVFPNGTFYIGYQQAFLSNRRY